MQAAALKLGYRPNAVVSHLLAQLRASRTPKYQATLGLINASENVSILNEIHTFREWVHGLRERADQLGYGVNDFWLHEKGMTPQRLAGIFRAQNIRGVIVAACLSNGTLPPGFDQIWENFACVMLGVRGHRPAVHLACNDQFSTVRRAFEEARRLGYTRPALVLNENVDELVEGRFSGGFVAAQLSLAAKDRISAFRFQSALDVPLTARIGTSEVLARFKEWFVRQQPDVLLCLHPEVRVWVESLGAKVPRDIGLIHLDWSDDLRDWAGMKQNNHLIGAAGVDMLIGQLHRNELGVPSFPKCLVVESSWISGETVRAPRNAAKTTRSRRSPGTR